MNRPELSTDVEDSRTVYVLSMRYVCAQLTDRKKKKGVLEGRVMGKRERMACAARKYFATDSTSQVPEMKY